MSEKLAVNSTITHYRILQKIGAGGMGEVFLAQDTKLDRKVALKLLPAEFAADIDRMSRFVREAKSASALNHPNIITIHEIGESDGTHFIATEFIDGKTLNDYAKNNSLSFTSILDISIQAASALDEAHAAGIVHRDIKPDNIMVRSNGLVKILDFGIAKLAEASPAANVSSEDATAIKPQSTSPGMIIGTANYMSPEQAKGQMVDARTDIFSFGVVLYEMIAGHLPFAGETPMGIIGAVIHKEPLPLNKKIPEEIERIVGKSLRKNRDERYQTIRDLLIDLKDVKQELEFQDKLEKKISPNDEEPKTQMLDATRLDEERKTAPAENRNESVTIKKSSVSIAFAGMLAILLIAVIGFFGYKYLSPTKQIESIAVMPFLNESSNQDAEYLSDGMTETLISSLSQLPNLNVKPRSSVFRYKDKETNLQNIGKELNVQAILTGRVIQRGQNISLFVELINISLDKVIWSETYNRNQSDLVTLQSDIARDVSSKLKTKLSTADEAKVTKSLTANAEAYQLYLKGNYHYAKLTKEDILKGIEYFRQAINLDPNFAMAYVKIADSYNVIPSFDYLSPKESIPKAKMAAQRALEIDPTLAEAHTALATSIAEFDWDWEKAEREFKRALELNPNVANTHFLYGAIYLVPMGRTEQAIAEIKRAAELEPLNMDVGANLAAAYMYDRQFERALEQALKIYDLDQNFVGGRIWLATMYAINGKYVEAIDICEKGLMTDPTNSPFLVLAGYAYAKNGQRQKAEQIVKRLQEVAKTQYVSHYWNAIVYSELGKRDEAFAELEKAYQARDYFMPRLKVEPFMDFLRDDPRFKDLLRRMNLTQ